MVLLRSQKRPLAFFRGTPYCKDVQHYIADRHINCSRLILSDMSRAHPDMINATITEDFEWEGRRWTAFAGQGFVPPAHHAEYQMLLNLDGYGASSRLGMLLATNSVVLKQASMYQEFYYRSLRPCVHYLPFWERNEGDVLELIQAVRREPEMAQAIAANAQAFAMLHLTDDAKFRYWEEALRRYAALAEKWE